MQVHININDLVEQIIELTTKNSQAMQKYESLEKHCRELEQKIMDREVAERAEELEKDRYMEQLQKDQYFDDLEKEIAASGLDFDIKEFEGNKAS